MIENPRISVVMPSYNQAEYLEQAILSVVMQEPKPFEFFVLDGGSTDGSVEIIRKYSEQITWWTSERDGGQSNAIHSGFQRATGDILCWLNSDDALLRGALAVIAREFSTRDADIVSGYLIYIDENSDILACPKVPCGSHWLARMGVINICQQSTFFRKELYDKVGGLDVSLHCCMDTDLWAKFARARPIWNHVPETLAAFRKHSTAKGSAGSWAETYNRERSMVRSRYPEFYGSLSKQTLGLLLYRSTQLVTLRHIQAALQTKKYRGSPMKASPWVPPGLSTSN